jgi:hypothetical protein
MKNPKITNIQFLNLMATPNKSPNPILTPDHPFEFILFMLQHSPLLHPLVPILPLISHFHTITIQSSKKEREHKKEWEVKKRGSSLEKRNIKEKDGVSHRF